jgi:hypothetical protein
LIGAVSRILTEEVLGFKIKEEGGERKPSSEDSETDIMEVD